MRAIVEEKDADAGAARAIDEINTGVMAAPTALLRRWVAALKPNNAQNEYYLTDIIALAVADGTPVVAHVAADERDVRGINDRAQLAAVERIVQMRHAHGADGRGNHARRSRAHRRSRHARSAAATCGSMSAACSKATSRWPTASRRPLLRAAQRDDRRRHAGSVPFSHLDDAKIGADCRIGPYARLRPGAALADEVHIGNFVEIKASTLGRGAKANHLAYIGDAIVGSNVNYGAGAIVANYDGANKHTTIIGDNVHIGSNCVLVAPVTIGAGCDDRRRQHHCAGRAGRRSSRWRARSRSRSPDGSDR